MTLHILTFFCSLCYAVGKSVRVCVRVTFYVQVFYCYGHKPDTNERLSYWAVYEKLQLVFVRVRSNGILWTWPTTARWVLSRQLLQHVIMKPSRVKWDELRRLNCLCVCLSVCLSIYLPSCPFLSNVFPSDTVNPPCTDVGRIETTG